MMHSSHGAFQFMSLPLPLHNVIHYLVSLKVLWSGLKDDLHYVQKKEQHFSST